MPVPRRDLELTRKRLTEWLATKLPDADDIRVSPLTGPGATGFSSDTLMFDLAWTEGGRERRDELVVRTKPTGFQVFPEYDLGQQFEIMRILGQTDVPVPRVFWMEEDESILDAPFYVMQRVSGQIPPDHPTYHTEGWVKEIPPEDRAAIWWDGLEALIRIHRLDWRTLGFGFLAESQSGKSPLEQQLAYYERYLEWAAEGKPQPTAEPALEWLKRNQPAIERVGLCWGDSRLGNMIFRDNRCVAVLDWEMATLADPDQDFAWWLFFDHHHSVGAGVPRLSGFPSREETQARYEERTGYKVRNLDYYEVFAAFRFAVIMIRVAKLAAAYGILPAESDFETNNTCTRILAGMLDLPPPDSQ